MGPLRVGIDAACLLGPKSGVAEYTINLFRAMAELRDLTLVPLGITSPDGSATGLPDLGSARLEFPTWRVKAKLLRALWRFTSFPRADWITGPVDVFHSPNYRVLPVGRTPLVVTVHDLTVLKFPHYHPMLRVIEMSASLRRLDKANAVVADSESTRRDILELLEVAPEKVHVVHLGYNAALFHPHIPGDAIAEIRQRHDILRPYILHVGALEPRKNLTRLIQAFALLRARGYKDHSLVLVGQKGWLYDDIFAEVRRQRLDGAVRFLGHVPDQDLPALYAGAEVFVYPSLYEGFGFPPLEAMACGTPVVTSRVSSLPEVVGDAAQLVNPYEVEEITAAIERLMGDAALRGELVSKGLKQAARFSWRKAAAQTLDIYDHLLAERQGSRVVGEASLP